MSLWNSIKNLYLCYYSKPAHRRVLFKHARRRPTSIVEVGLDSVDLTKRLLTMLKRMEPEGSIQYTGIDQFDAREHNPHNLTLKSVHREVLACGVKPKLVPGDVSAGLARTANSLVGTDLLIIGAAAESQLDERAWMFVPRMLHHESTILVERVTDEKAHYERVDLSELATSVPMRRAA